MRLPTKGCSMRDNWGVPKIFINQFNEGKKKPNPLNAVKIMTTNRLHCTVSQIYLPEFYIKALFGV